MIIGLLGNNRSGKDTIADYLVKNYNFKKYAFADQIKRVSKEVFGWSYETINNKDELDTETGIVPRKFFEWFGTDVMQYDFTSSFPDSNIPPNSIWAYSILKQIQDDMIKYNSLNYNIIITDFRFKHEYELFIDKMPEIKFSTVTRYIPGVTDWQYDIFDILSKMRNTKVPCHDIENNGTILELYERLDTYIKDNNIEKHSFDYNINIKNAYFQ
jgi:hypothetical protein